MSTQLTSNVTFECPMCHDDFFDRMTGYLSHSEIHDRFAMADLLLSQASELARLRESNDTLQGLLLRVLLQYEKDGGPLNLWNDIKLTLNVSFPSFSAAEGEK